MDLTQVEGLMDLIDADTEVQHQYALRAVQVCFSFFHGTQVRARSTYAMGKGDIRNEYTHLRTRIIKALSLVEAVIDFSEGEDLESGVFEQGRLQFFIVSCLLF